MSAWYTTEDVKNILSKKGYSLADKNYVPKQKTNVICPQGHHLSVFINNFKDGMFICKQCKDAEFLQHAQNKVAPLGYTVIGYLDSGKRLRKNGFFND